MSKSSDKKDGAGQTGAALSALTVTNDTSVLVRSGAVRPEPFPSEASC